MRKTVLQFITSLTVFKLDEHVLIQHIEECQLKASGPGLNDMCTDRVRWAKYSTRSLHAYVCQHDMQEHLYIFACICNIYLLDSGLHCLQAVSQV